MGRSLDEVIGSLPADRQAKIAALAEKKVDEMIAHAATLTDFREAVGKTQVEFAEKLGITQNAASQLEKRSDTYVSTLRKYLQSLDMTLELSVVSKSGTRIALPNFHPWDDVIESETIRTPGAPATVPAIKGRRPAAKKHRQALRNRRQNRALLTSRRQSNQTQATSKSAAPLSKKRKTTCPGCLSQDRITSTLLSTWLRDPCCAAL